jgi:pyruvate/2-oxoglutarate/acetoin dehydrogenase E1 component
MIDSELTYHEARTRAICRELSANPDAIVIGPSLSLPFNPPDQLPERFPGQVLIAPYSEFAISAAAIGAAIAGLRPLVALSTASFMYYAWSAIVNEAPLVRYLSGGAVQAPVAIHVHAGSRRGGGPQHEHTPQAMLQAVSGLRVLTPGTPSDIDAALHVAMTGPDPTVILDHVLLAQARGPVGPAPPGPAGPQPMLLHRGGDALLVASSVMAQRALAAAEVLESEGRAVAVLNLPVVSPPPVEAVLSAARGHRLVVFIDESRAAGSPAASLMASLLGGRPDLRAEIICSADAPAPFALELLDEVVPTTARIAQRTRELIDRCT